jgi:uncharacterized FlaG/YvyC family protein
MDATIMFAVGVLTMVLLATVSLTIYSTVMVLKLKKRIEELTRYTQDESSNIYRNIIEREECYTRRLREVNDQLQIEMRLGEEELSNQIGQLNEHNEQLQSYVDRRFDKLIDTYLLVKETEKESKKLIKG